MKKWGKRRPSKRDKTKFLIECSTRKGPPVRRKGEGKGGRRSGGGRGLSAVFLATRKKYRKGGIALNVERSELYSGKPRTIL